MYDCIIVGAGPSGMMCAIKASEKNKKVLLIDKNPYLGKKMSLTGGGRCNITNLKDPNDFIEHLPTKNGRFLYSALSKFNPNDIFHFFEELGVTLKVENDDRVFPKSDKALDLITALHKKLIDNKVELKLATEVLDIEKKNHFIVYTVNEKYFSQKLVIATGGCSYPHTGSTGFGYEIAKKFNHHICELFPTESPIISFDEIIKSRVLQGLAFTNISLSLLNKNNKIIKAINDDLIFTHFGLSGPSALKLSQFVYHELKKQKTVKIMIDFLPQYDQFELKNILLTKKETDKTIKVILKDFLPQRFIDFLLCDLKISTNQKIANISNQQLDNIISKLKTFIIEAHSIKPLKEAFVTGGGVNLQEINAQTMESKIVSGLYFCGEVLDLHGHTGGYNLTIALTTGYSAGLSI
ncbi:MAG TPA: NAD(P)/FAD-dependent oxidoreductase [Haloplasmataceae bacterium]